MKDQSKTKQVRSKAEHRKVEQALKESDNSGWSILEIIQEGYYEVDLAGNYTFCNSFMSEILGYPKEKMTGMNYRLYMDKETAKKIFRDFNEVYRTGIPSKVSYEQIKKDGSKMYAETSIALIRDSFGQPTGFRGIVRDITERKRLEEALRESQAFYHSLVDQLPAGVFRKDAEGRFVFVSPWFCRLKGMKEEEFLGKTPQDVIASETAKSDAKEQGFKYAAEGADHHVRIMQNGNPIELVEEYTDAAGEKQFVQAIKIPVFNSEGKVIGTQGILFDITKRKLAEEALQESETRYRSMFENNHAVMLLVDPDNAAIIDANPAACAYYGWSREEMMKRRIDDINTLTREEVSVEMQLARSEKRNHFFFKHRRADDTIRDVEVYSGPILMKGKTLLYSIVHDITDRKQAEAKLRQQIDAMEAAIDGMALLNEEGIYIYLNKAHAKIYGYENAGELIGKSWMILYDSNELQRFEQEIMPEFGRKGDWHGEAIGMKKDGSKFPQEVSLTATADGGLICVVRDITERKRADEELKESEKLYRMIAENMTDVITVMDMNLRLTFVSPSIMRLLGITVEEAMAQPLEQVMTPESLLLAYRSYQEEMQLESSGTADPNRIRIIELEEYRKDMSTVWVEITLSFLHDAAGRSIGMLSLTHDISKRKRAEGELQRSLESLRKAFGTIIQVMVSAVEARDPYTSGHQLRSADLARAIATEMGLSPEKIEGIRMASSIHDIGKLSIPAEILSKPKKLSEIEFSLIKEHPRKGFEMLKDVESPWPLAEIVYQHHERIDGSGYPSNLKGEEILIEARILAVADVVEAMASHRPYRPGLGIDAALNEIEKNSGIFYDNAVADACLRLFREKGFKLGERLDYKC